MADKYSLSPNVNKPKNIGEIVLGAYEKAGIEPPMGEAASWLGRWDSNGWAIKISPKLTDAQWATWSTRADETFDEEKLEYSSERSLKLLVELFGDLTMSVVYPTCGFRSKFVRPDRRTPVYVVCNNTAKHTVTWARDVYGNRIAIARCDEHEGLLGP